MSLTRITDAVEEPVTLAEAKLHLRVDHSSDDQLITALIVAARQAAEERMQRSLLPQTWEKRLDLFPAGIELPRGPVTSITSVKFLDSAGVLQTLDPADYQLDSTSEFLGWLVPAVDVDWPDTQENINAVRVRYLAGWANPAAVPGAIKQWILAMVGATYTHRELAASGTEVRTLGFLDRLLDPYTVVSL